MIDVDDVDEDGTIAARSTSPITDNYTSNNEVIKLTGPVAFAATPSIHIRHFFALTTSNAFS